MKNTIEKVLEKQASLQLNLESKSAREFLAEEISNELLTIIGEIFAKGFEEVLSAEEEPEDIIREALSQGGFEAGDSGYEFSTGIRDIDFHNKKTGKTYVVTIQQRDDEDTFEL